MLHRQAETRGDSHGAGLTAPARLRMLEMYSLHPYCVGLALEQGSCPPSEEVLVAGCPVRRHGPGQEPAASVRCVGERSGTVMKQYRRG